MKQFFAPPLKVITSACVAGVGLALLLTRLVEEMLFGVSPTDPMVLSAVIAIVMAVAIAGALVPAVRASMLEPMRVLRDQ